MGAESSHDWHPPPQPAAGQSSDGSPVDYHIVASEVCFWDVTECNCCSQMVKTVMDSDTMYDMLAQQYPKGYRMLYFDRRPGDMRLSMGGNTIRAFFIGFFRMKPNLGEYLEAPTTWSLRVERSWVEVQSHSTGGIFSLTKDRVLDTSQIVDSLTRNTHHGERLVAATVTGHTDQAEIGVTPRQAMDLFFEVPNPPTRERYTYNIALIPVHVEFPFLSVVRFPEMQCDWNGVLQFNLRQGWRLIDIFIYTPRMEQFRVQAKHRTNMCRPGNTNSLWIFERPASVAINPHQRYEGTIVEQKVRIWDKGLGVTSTPDWLPLITKMGHKGWELACVVESHKVDGGGFSGSATHINSLLFFQRPLNIDPGQVTFEAPQGMYPGQATFEAPQGKYLGCV